MSRGSYKAPHRVSSVPLWHKVVKWVGGMGLTTAVCVGLVYAASSNWNPGPIPAGATPSTGNVAPLVHGGQACASGQMVTGFDAMGSVVCGGSGGATGSWCGWSSDTNLDVVLCHGKNPLQGCPAGYKKVSGVYGGGDEMGFVSATGWQSCIQQ